MITMMPTCYLFEQYLNSIMFETLLSHNYLIVTVQFKMNWKYIFFASAFIIVLAVGMDQSEFELAVFGRYDHSNEAALIDAMKTSEHLLSTVGAQITIEIASAIIAAASTGASIAVSLAQATIIAITSNDGELDKRAVAKSIIDTIDRKNTIMVLDELRAKLMSLEEQFNSIDSVTSNDVIVAKVSDIQSKFSDMVNLLDEKDSVIIKYPEILAEVLLKLADAYIIFFPVFLKYDRDYATRSKIPCEFLSVLENYRDLYVYYRLYKVKPKSCFNGLFCFHRICMHTLY